VTNQTFLSLMLLHVLLLWGRLISVYTTGTRNHPTASETCGSFAICANSLTAAGHL
jgi:hypothetical protein